MTRARLSPDEMALSVGASRERTARKNLVALRSSGVADDDDRLPAAEQRISEACAMQGKFEEAARVSPDAGMRAHYAGIAAAVKRGDAEACDCPALDKDNLPTAFVSERVYSEKHKRIMPLVKCSICGFQNVRTMPDELARMERERKKAHDEAKGGGGK